MSTADAPVLFLLSTEARIWSGTLTPHCVLSRIWFYETLNLRLVAWGGGCISRRRPLPQTLLSSAIHGGARSQKFCVSNFHAKRLMDAAIRQSREVLNLYKSHFKHVRYKGVRFLFNGNCGMSTNARKAIYLYILFKMYILKMNYLTAWNDSKSD